MVSFTYSHQWNVSKSYVEVPVQDNKKQVYLLYSHSRSQLDQRSPRWQCRGYMKLESLSHQFAICYFCGEIPSGGDCFLRSSRYPKGLKSFIIFLILLFQNQFYLLYQLRYYCAIWVPRLCRHKLQVLIFHGCLFFPTQCSTPISLRR